MKKTVLCTQADLQNGEAREFNIHADNGEHSVFVVKQQEQLFAYYNACPHTGGPLNWQADVFLDFFKQRIQCSLHGAQFEIRSGKCIYGPCRGEYLDALAVSVENNNIVVEI